MLSTHTLETKVGRFPECNKRKFLKCPNFRLSV